MTKKEEREARKLEKLRLEKERMYKMFSFEREYADRQSICGIDEVGRGPFAGPVVAAAVILPKDCDILYLNDSKKLSEKKRELLYDEIYEKAVAIGIGMSSEKVIDEINILQATYKAMQQAISKLSVKPDLLLNDAVTIPEVDIEQVPTYMECWIIACRKVMNILRNIMPGMMTCLSKHGKILLASIVVGRRFQVTSEAYSVRFMKWCTITM